MKFTPLAVLGLAVAAVTSPVAAIAQSDAMPAAAPATAMAFTTDTPIETLVADERAKAVLSKHVPGIDVHPAYDQFKTLSLKALAPFSQGLITEDLLTKIAADLATIK